MGYTNIALKDKIVEMYPEIEKHDIFVSLDFDRAKNAYIVKLKKDSHDLTTKTATISLPILKRRMPMSAWMA